MTGQTLLFRIWIDSRKSPLKLGLSIAGGLLAFLLLSMVITVCFLWNRKNKKKINSASAQFHAQYSQEKCSIHVATTSSDKYEKEYSVEYKRLGHDDEPNANNQEYFITLQLLIKRLESNLGSGQFGEVYKGVWYGPQGEVDVAVKTLKEEAELDDKIKFLQEAAIMAQFKDPNVVTMYGVVAAGEPILLILELLPNGDLLNHLKQECSEKNNELSIDGHTLLSYCRQVVSGMVYLSGKGFVHRDLAARNILVSEQGICKIADFGMARDLLYETSQLSRNEMIPVKWTSPEAIHYKWYSSASDVWSFGVVMYEIWSVGQKPFQEFTNSKVISIIDSGFRLPPPPGCPRKIYSLMIKCWHPEAAKRPPFIDVRGVLSLPDSTLLKVEEVDKCKNPEVLKIGHCPNITQNLYADLQKVYQR